MFTLIINIGAHIVQFFENCCQRMSQLNCIPSIDVDDCMSRIFSDESSGSNDSDELNVRALIDIRGKSSIINDNSFEYLTVYNSRYTQDELFKRYFDDVKRYGNIGEYNDEISDKIDILETSSQSSVGYSISERYALESVV